MNKKVSLACYHCRLWQQGNSGDTFLFKAMSQQTVDK